MSKSILRYRMAKKVAQTAGHLEQEALRAAAKAALAEGLSVRQFGDAVGMSKSHAGRELRSAHIEYIHSIGQGRLVTHLTTIIDMLVSRQSVPGHRSRGD